MARREPFPLQWPAGFRRTKASAREKSRFGHRSSGQVSLSYARDSLLSELQRLGAANVVLTTDLPVRNDGLPYADGRATDPGVAVWFILSDSRGNHQERVFACDRWKTHAENMMAIMRSVEAMRGLDRWGMADVVERLVGGFAALPPGSDPTPEPPNWREVFDVVDLKLAPADMLSVVKGRYRYLLATEHPDKGGNAGRAAEINAALSAAQEELGAR